MIKTYRGILADGEQDRIRLQTIKGNVGYVITKFQVIQKTPGAAHAEAVVKIYKSSQSTIDGIVNFTDSDLLGVVFYNKSDSVTYAGSTTIIFDSEVVNQDIFVTGEQVGHSDPMNYYIELKVIPLDDAGAEYTTLKDMRQV